MSTPPRNAQKLLVSTAFRSVGLSAVVLLSTALSAQEAAAVSVRVRIACASDYFAYCSAHAPNSPGVRQCMRAAGRKLSKRCVNALVGAGEITENEVARKAAELKK